MKTILKVIVGLVIVCGIMASVEPTKAQQPASGWTNYTATCGASDTNGTNVVLSSYNINVNGQVRPAASLTISNANAFSVRYQFGVPAKTNAITANYNTLGAGATLSYSGSTTIFPPSPFSARTTSNGLGGNLQIEMFSK